MTNKGPCPACPSSDAFTTYDDGHGHCFSCGHHTGTNTPTKEAPKVGLKMIHQKDITFTALPARRLSAETCKLWSYGVSTYSGKPVQVASYRDMKGHLVAQKVRFQNKDFLILGDAKAIGLYGQNLWKDGGRRVVVTEGEIDALSVSQMQGNKWPVVSIPNGAKAAKAVLQKQLEWLEKFDEVVLCFDSDEAGQEAVAECVDLFKPGKCKAAVLPLKDANEMLQQDRGDEIIPSIWNAKAYRPDGIVPGVELWETINTPLVEGTPYPWPKLNSLLHGRRRGEIVLFTAGTGTGKSEAVGQVAYHGLMAGETLGYIALEETTKHTSLRLMGLHMGKRLHIDREGVTEADMKTAFDATVGSGRVYLYDHWGSTESENLMAKIRYMARGLGCTTIVLDHISIVVSGIEGGDERRIIDNTMTQLRTLVQELNVSLLLICHLKRPEGTPHEEGGRVKLADLRGSGSLAQLVDIVVAQERDQQDEVMKQWTLLRVLKNRLTGETGEAGYLKYEEKTGRLHESSPVLETAEKNPF